MKLVGIPLKKSNYIRFKQIKKFPKEKEKNIIEIS